MTAVKWKPFPHNAKDYAYQGAALKSASPELHRGDCEPFPDAAFIKQAFARHRRLKGALDAEKAAVALQSAWRAYHRDDFGAAVAEGTVLGPIGANAANKAAKREILLDSAKRAEALQAAAPDFPNAPTPACRRVGQLRPLHLTSEIEVPIVAPVDAGRRILDLLTIAPIAHDPVSDLLLDVVEPDRSL